MNIEFSLDCELLWGMPPGIKKDYIQNNIENDEPMLEKIVDGWLGNKNKLYLAFVLNALPNKLDHLYDNHTTSTVISKHGLKTAKIEYSNCLIEKIEGRNDKNIRMGVHGVSHSLYNEMTRNKLEVETCAIEKFLKNNREYSSLMVFPKNIIDYKLMPRYINMFSKIRINSASWLYKTNKNGVTKIKRILRYLDSFVPIYELFCDKRPEYENFNIVVGTHFYRANLPGILLMVHIFRLRIGIKIMEYLGHDVHIWSHPHNFTSPKSVDNFIKLVSPH